jgi:redox-sensitive bicupin YhaK (pirin superfamily)
MDGSVLVAGCHLEPPALGYLGVGRDELRLDVTEPARVLLIGGAPLSEPLLMWWNYVARERSEIVDAHRAWNERDDRFGQVASSLDRMTTGDPPWV